MASSPGLTTLRDQAVAGGRAEPHHVLPDTGWVRCWMKCPEDAANLIELLREQYDRYLGTSSSRS